MKEVVREPLYFEGNLDPNHFLKGRQILEDYLRVRGCLDEESFMIATQKLHHFAYYSSKCFRRERALKKKS